MLPGDNTGIRKVISACVRNFLKHCSQVRGLLVIVQVRYYGAPIVPLRLPAKELLNKVPVGIVSVTLNVPGFNVTSTPVDEPAKSAGIGLLPVTCIVKLAAVKLGLPDTIFVTVNVAVVGAGARVGVGVDDGVRVVLLPVV